MAALMLDENRKTQVLQMTGADMNVRIVGPGVKLPPDMLDLTE